jgi:hypothetical protein
VCSCQEHLKTTEDVIEHLRGDKNWSNDGHGRQCQFPGCKTISPQTYNAKRHWKTHLPKRLRNYFCPKCDESYAKWEQLEKHMAAPVCLKNRKRCRTVFEEDPALAITLVIPRDDMPSPDGHAAELETTSDVPPSTGTTSPPSATSTPSLTEEVAGMQKAAWLEENGSYFPPSVLHHTQHPNDTRANTGTYTCTYDGCTHRFESQPALQQHKWYFHPSQEHNDNDSGAESGTSSVSPRPHARPVLRSDHTHVPHVQLPKRWYAGRELPKFRVLVEGCWDSVGSLLSDLTENAFLDPRWPSSTSLWGAIMKATPPESLREMFDLHLIHCPVDVRASQRVVDLEWTEEGITGHWQEFGAALKWPEGTARRIVVDTLS